MAIDSLRDGFVRLCFDPSLNVVGDSCAIVLEGQYYDPAQGCTVTADELVKVTSARDIDCQFGAGSVLAESLKVAIDCCGQSGVEIFALPRADAAGATAAQYTLTVTGTATTDGTIDVFWGEARYNTSTFVTTGDTATEIAAAIVADLPEDLPYTATAATGVITFVARNAGTVGNYFQPQINWAAINGRLPQGVTYAAAQTVVGATDPEPLDLSSVLNECCVCCYAALTGDRDWQRGVINYFDDAWSCEKPQCFGHAYTYNAGTLGQILVADSNSATISRLAHCTTDPIFPWLKVAAYAAASCCRTLDNPEVSIQGNTFGILDCVSAPESCAQCFTYEEQVQLRDAGFVVAVPVSGGTGGLTSPMITNDVTNNRYDDQGRENLTFQSVAARRLATATSTAIAEQLAQYNGLGYFTDGTAIQAGTQGVNRRLVLGRFRAWARSQVGSLFSEFDDIDSDIQLTDDFQVAPQCQGTPGVLYLNMIYRPPVRIQSVRVNAAPRLLDNC